MAKFWTEEEVQFLIENLSQPTKEIFESFNKLNNNRSYDSVQKKVKDLRKKDAVAALELLESKTIVDKTAENKSDDKVTLTKEQKETLDLYIDTLKDLGHKPSMSELADRGITRSALRHRWNNLTKLEKAARVLNPELFREVSISTLFDSNHHQALRSRIRDKKKFLITTAITGHRVDTKLLETFDVYCEENDAILLVMIAADPAHQRAHDDELGYLDDVLKEYNLILQETALNDNLYLSGIKLSAKQIDPVTGLNQIAQQDGSYIFASPRQRLRFVPVPMHKHPPAIMGTGAITVPNYTTDMYMSRRTGYMAERTHKMGAIVVEIEDDEIFHFRQVQGDENGSIVDWGIKYNSDGTIEYMKLKALIAGDLHAGREDDDVILARVNICEELNPEYIVLHDLFDGTSISHHVTNKTISKARREEILTNNLVEELENTGQCLSEYTDLCDEVIIVKSNHDEHLDRYLEEARFINDPPNYRISLNLAAHLYDGEDPLKCGIETVNEHDFSNVRFLKRDEEFIVAGVELGYHGDKGPNGARGNIKSLAHSVKASVTGHSHTAEIFNNAWRVGTSTKHLDYCSGPSSWTNTDCLLYANGSMQLVNYIDGRYKA